MKSGTRQHQAVNQSYCDADVDALCEGAERATDLRTVNQELVVDTCVPGRNNEWLSVDSEANVADESFIENLIDEFTIVNSAFGKAFKCGALGLGEVGHRRKNLRSSILAAD